MELFQIFIKKKALYQKKKALYQKKSTSGKTIFFIKKKAFLQKVPMKMNIFYKKRKIISCFLRKMTKNRKNRILLVFISNN